MISYLAGKILIKTDRFVILDINGVGYKVFVPERLIEGLEKSQEAKFFVYSAIKDNAWDLYGFLDMAELEFYELLLSISGIGPKTAMNILSGVSVNDLEEAIVLGEEEIISRASGVTKKMAGRIILELKSKVKKLSKSKGERSMVAQEIEVIDALVSLGYKVFEIREAMKNLPKEAVRVEDMVKETLKSLGKK